MRTDARHDLARGLLVVMLAATGASAASCPDDTTSQAAVVSVREAIAAACDCASAASPAAFASCARDVVRSAVDGGTLPRACRGTVMRCVRASTCGVPGSVTCCRTVPNGVRCRRRRTAESCAHPSASVCTGAFGACCAECVSAGCITTTSTTSTTIPCGGTPSPTCGGSCPSGSVCQAGQTIQGGVATRFCACTIHAACGSLNSDCDFGPCPAGLSCTADFDTFTCSCRP